MNIQEAFELFGTLVNKTEAAEIYGCEPSYIGQLIREGKIQQIEIEKQFKNKTTVKKYIALTELKQYIRKKELKQQIIIKNNHKPIINIK